MKLSVLTVHFNDFEGLSRTARSIARQGVPVGLDVEWLIQDAATTSFDEFIAEHRSLFEMAKIVSRRDKGIYDGMNLVLERASGDFVIFMNAGDEFCGSDAFEHFLRGVEDSTDVLLGAAGEVKDGVVVGSKSPRRSRYALWYGMPTHHQAIYYRREAVARFPFETRYRFAADYDQLLRLARCGACFHYIAEVVCLFGLEGVSSTSYWKAHFEQARVRIDRGISSWPKEAPMLFAKIIVRYARTLAPALYARVRYVDAR